MYLEKSTQHGISTLPCNPATSLFVQVPGCYLLVPLQAGLDDSVCSLSAIPCSPGGASVSSAIAQATPSRQAWPAGTPYSVQQHVPVQPQPAAPQPETAVGPIVELAGFSSASWENTVGAESLHTPEGGLGLSPALPAGAWHPGGASPDDMELGIGSSSGSPAGGEPGQYDRPDSAARRALDPVLDLANEEEGPAALHAGNTQVAGPEAAAADWMASASGSSSVAPGAAAYLPGMLAGTGAAGGLFGNVLHAFTGATETASSQPAGSGFMQTMGAAMGTFFGLPALPQKQQQQQRDATPLGPANGQAKVSSTQGFSSSKVRCFGLFGRQLSDNRDWKCQASCTA